MRSSDPNTQIRLVNNNLNHKLMSFPFSSGSVRNLCCLSPLQWYTLNDVKSGKVHLILEWVPTVSHSLTLDQVGSYPLFTPV